MLLQSDTSKNTHLSIPAGNLRLERARLPACIRFDTHKRPPPWPLGTRASTVGNRLGDGRKSSAGASAAARVRRQAASGRRGRRSGCRDRWRFLGSDTPSGSRSGREDARFRRRKDCAIRSGAGFLSGRDFRQAFPNAAESSGRRKTRADGNLWAFPGLWLVQTARRVNNARNRGPGQGIEAPGVEFRFLAGLVACFRSFEVTQQ